ncbi:coiled-coil domain-containing protein-domain-containing protein [Cladorrhinum sp. PSN259]|nr:coiled-coil domain-containing protein-domain-containing protein [Cladorrhinum sp. PSN259]
MAPRFTTTGASSSSQLADAKPGDATIDFGNLSLIEDRPTPRPPRSPATVERIRVQNRRREYLERHPEYFFGGDMDHELADPLLYDSLIRRFWTPAEREADGKSKGYARVLEGSLLRGEERLAKLREQNVSGLSSSSNRENGDGMVLDDANQEQEQDQELENEEEEDEDEEALGTGEASHNAELITPPKTKKEGQEQWKEFLRDRFIRGKDDDFDYQGEVDGREDLDVVEEREREDEWFEQESARWASDEEEDDDDEGGGGMHVERELKGETGVQDF